MRVKQKQLGVKCNVIEIRFYSNGQPQAQDVI